jgi:hypothetical protein
LVAEAGNALTLVFSGRARQIDAEIGKEVGALQHDVQVGLYGISGEGFLGLLEKAIGKAWEYRKEIFAEKKKKLEVMRGKLVSWLIKVLDAISMQPEAEQLKTLAERLRDIKMDAYASASPPQDVSLIVRFLEQEKKREAASEKVIPIARSKQGKDAYSLEALRVIDGQGVRAMMMQHYALFEKLDQLLVLSGTPASAFARLRAILEGKVSKTGNASPQSVAQSPHIIERRVA